MSRPRRLRLVKGKRVKMGTLQEKNLKAVDSEWRRRMEFEKVQSAYRKETRSLSTRQKGAYAYKRNQLRRRKRG